MPIISNNYPFLSGGGQMGERIRSFDWSLTRLGSPQKWPAALKQTVSNMLSSAFPMLICWGDEYIQLYNDAFIPINSCTKHPSALGVPASTSYANIWDTIEPVFARVMKGETLGFTDFMPAPDRNGLPEGGGFDFSCSPIRDEDGLIKGLLVICTETTEKAQAIELLKASQKSLLKAVRQAPVGICIVKGEPLMVEEANDAFLGIIGKKREQFNYTPYWQVNTETAAIYEPLVNSVLVTGQSYHANEQKIKLIRNGKKEIAYFDFLYEPVKAENGNVEAIMIVAIDVTEKVKARKAVEENAAEFQALNEELAAVNEEFAVTNEELIETQHILRETNTQLAESESRLRMAVESTKLGTWDYYIPQDKLFLSRECRIILGLSPKERVSFSTFTDLIHNDDSERVQQKIENSMVASSDGHYDVSYRIIRPDNKEIRWIRVRGTIDFNPEGQATRHVATILDITESKLAEEKSAKLAAIVESSDDAIISKTLESVITSWNDSAERMFGYTADEIIGQLIYKLIPDDRYEEEPRILARLKRGERVDHFETKRITKEGKLLDVSLTISPVKDNEGNIIGLSKIIRDITEKKQDEARKNDFIGMVSHELKTPLTSLNALLQVVKIKLSHSEDSFLTGAMEKANQQVKRMTSMINGFLNISRLESGKILIEKQLFDIEELVAEVIDETKITVSTHVLNFEPCQSVQVMADRDKISSVISNLLSNAVKYSPKGKNVEVRCTIENKSVVVSVKDEGMGIKPADLNKIFDRYYRIQTDHTRHISGFGIGLYLSAEIIRRHKGSIWAESKTGVGSTFFFSLPLSD